MARRKVWHHYPDRPELVKQVSSRHGVPPLIARLLLNRGLTAPEEILAFLEPTLERLSNPFGLPDLGPAAARLARAVREREPVVIYGDYDADGLTAACLMHQFLQELGLACHIYIPDRLQEGYGLNRSAISRLAKQSRLLVTVDCGLSDVEEVAFAQRQGLEVIITDHHELPAVLPPATAVVNPKRGGGTSPFTASAGVGVALLLALAVRAHLRQEGWFRTHPEPNLRNYLDLVAVGTAADVVPVVGENRIFLFHGLKVLEETRRPGLLALKEVAGLEGRPLTYRDLCFRLAPRLNAAGRLGQATGALSLLLASDLSQARIQARLLNELNRQRQALEQEVLRQASRIIQHQRLEERPALVLAGEGWHPGVLGIAAARLAEEYHRPVALISLKDGWGQGSARSVEGYHLYKGLEACQEHLHKFGGHEAAAGFVIREENLPAFREALERNVLDQAEGAPLRPCLKVDATVRLGDLDREFLTHLQRLRPFGPGNPEPVFVSTGVEGLHSRVVGERHLKLALLQGDVVLEAIAFDQARFHPLTGPLEVAFSTRFSFYMGQLLPEFHLLDWVRLPG